MFVWAFQGFIPETSIPISSSGKAKTRAIAKRAAIRRYRSLLLSDERKSNIPVRVSTEGSESVARNSYRYGRAI